MPKNLLLAVALGVAVGTLAVPARALVCNIVFDRNDQVIYRDTVPPIDLSDDGSMARAEMRHRGEYLMVIDSDRCSKVTPTSAKSGTATVDEIVAGMRPYLGAGGGRASAGGQAAGGVASNARPAAPAATSSRGTSARGY
ncbi:MAG TPA: hypothetical protein VJQ49_05095 [Casimicrobiaceae bacterium]|nr:hypothetical protein [Casimicrobiaceae bacterium]